MENGKSRKKLFVVLVLLFLGSVVTVYLAHDPEVDEIRRMAQGYMGDLQNKQVQSASRRVLPDDLLALKASGMEHAALSIEFRADAETFFKTRDVAVMEAQSKERFFRSLVWRTFELHPLIHEALRRGKNAGVSTSRSDEKGKVDVALSLATEEDDRRFVMRLELSRLDDQWWVRI
ncbi:MAG: hypothetical protein ISR64_11450 [Deltaproteobacteria bacterium]|nr:hypothetical protein [Deltaproteobacteria bacterium]